METRIARLRAFGNHAARAQDRCLAADPVDATVVHERLAMLETDRVAAPRRSFRHAWATSAVAAAIGCGVMFWPRAHAPLQFEVGPSEVAEPLARPEQGRVGGAIAAPAQALLPLRFSDGSVIRLQAGSLARVASVTPNGAHVVLDSGSAQAHVVHRDGARWDLEAGPFHVRVVGTSFDIDWDPASELFTLSLEQGKVVVSGCSLHGERSVAEGETFRASCRGGLFHPEPSPMASTARQAQAPKGGSFVLPLTPPSMSSGSIPSSAPGPSAVQTVRSAPIVAPRWEELLSNGQVNEAIDVVEGQGPSAGTSETDVSILMKLADAERFAGRADSAARVLRRIRELSPNDPRASVAAFHLGRMAFDRGSFGEALVWFNIYLDERPTGVLSREASGRVMEALERNGNRGAAQEAASRYLARFPDGPHAELARSLITP